MLIFRPYNFFITTSIFSFQTVRYSESLSFYDVSFKYFFSFYIQHSRSYLYHAIWVIIDSIIECFWYWSFINKTKNWLVSYPYIHNYKKIKNYSFLNKFSIRAWAFAPLFGLYQCLAKVLIGTFKTSLGSIPKVSPIISILFFSSFFVSMDWQVYWI